MELHRKLHILSLNRYAPSYKSFALNHTQHKSDLLPDSHSDQSCIMRDLEVLTVCLRIVRITFGVYR